MSAARPVLLSTAMLGAVLWLGLGCASNDVETGVSFDPLYRFPAQATFAWDERANRLPRNQDVAALDLGPMLTRVVNQEMAARGYTATTSGAHYRLSYHVSVNTWHGAEGSLSVASLSLQMSEAESHRRVWVGFARANVLIGLTEAQREQRLHQTVGEMLEKFPPRGL